MTDSVFARKPSLIQRQFAQKIQKLSCQRNWFRYSAWSSAAEPETSCVCTFEACTKMQCHCIQIKKVRVWVQLNMNESFLHYLHFFLHLCTPPPPQHTHFNWSRLAPPLHFAPAPFHKSSNVCRRPLWEASSQTVIFTCFFSFFPNLLQSKGFNTQTSTPVE